MHELTEEALVAASVDVVWSDFTDASDLAEWYWPPRLEATTTVDPGLQGVWEVRSDVAGIAVVARVVSAQAPLDLHLAWRWDDDEHSTDVQITLAPVADDATRVIVRHSGFATAEERELHVEGWSHCLLRLTERHAE